MEWIGLMETMYHVAGIVLVIGLFFGYKQVKITTKNIELAQKQLTAANDSVQLAAEQLKILKKDNQDNHKRKSVEKSLEYLSLFASEVIPEINKYHRTLREESNRVKMPEITNDKFVIDPSELEEDVLREVIIRQNEGCMHILNKLEYFSVAAMNGLADEDLIFTPLSKPLCDFVQSEYVYLSILRYEGVPFKNLVDLYHKWYDRMEVERLTLQVEETQGKILAKGDSHKSTKPIGI